MNTIKTRRYVSPVGELILGAIGDRLCLCDWNDEQRRAAVDATLRRLLDAKFEDDSGDSEVIDLTVAELNAYFNGSLQSFSVPVTVCGTPFQRRVREELMRIPFGSTVSYAELARRINRPRAVRAVASAIASNPISIIVPCHRVVGSNGTLTGYAGGLDAKRRLLTLEAAG